MWETITSVLLTILQKIIEGGKSFGPHIQASLVSAVFTTLFLVSFMISWNMIAERSVVQGWIDTEAFFFRSNGSLLRAMEQHHVQMYLAREERAQKVILSLLQEYLVTDTTPVPARVRLALIHDGSDGLNPLSALRYDITATVTSPGYGPGPVETNVPLLTASDFIDAMLSKKCSFIYTGDLNNVAFKSVMLGGSSTAFLACPVTAPNGQVLGFTTEEWVYPSSVPADDQLHALKTNALRINADLGVALEAANS